MDYHGISAINHGIQPINYIYLSVDLPATIEFNHNHKATEGNNGSLRLADFRAMVVEAFPSIISSKKNQNNVSRKVIQ